MKTKTRERSSNGNPTAGAELEHGTVKWYSKDKAYGFISRDRKTDVFFHYSGLAARLRNEGGVVDGTQVVFNVVEGSKGLKAVNIDLERD